jgi:hypothetical protein
MPVPQPKLIPLPFPFKGIHEDSELTEQPEGTTPDAVNVRGYDYIANRDRGAQRPGLDKYVPARQDTVPIDGMCVGTIDGSFLPHGSDNSYSWDDDDLLAGRNDGGDSFTSVLTTTDPRDPATYLIYDPAFITNLITTNNGDGTWDIDYDTVTNCGSPTPTSTVLSAAGNDVTIHFPGYVYYTLTISIGLGGQTYKKNGGGTSLPVFLDDGDQIEATGPSATSVGIQGTMLVSDNRMTPPTITFGSGSGPGGTPTGSFGAIFSHNSTFAATYNESSPFGGSTITGTIPEKGVTVKMTCAI